MAGGIERPVAHRLGRLGESYSPDGPEAGASHGIPATWSRKHYRGSYAADLWVMDVAGNESFHAARRRRLQGQPHVADVRAATARSSTSSNQLDNEKGNQVRRARSDDEGVNNIWKISDKGGKEIAGHHITPTCNLFSPASPPTARPSSTRTTSAPGSSIQPAGRAAKSSSISRPIRRRTRRSWSPSPNRAGIPPFAFNQRAAVVAHGEIFTIATDRGEPQRVSETPWKEQEPRWSPNGKWIAFVSDRTRPRKSSYLPTSPAKR
mgnify:CR=1 FL=1